MELSKVLYTARATAEGGRDGRTATDDGKLDLILAPPKELGGNGNGTNPEQLMAAGFASCFHNALKTVARRAKVSVDGSSVTAEVGIGPLTGGIPGYGLTAAIAIHLPGHTQEEADQLVATADRVCPFSNATRGNMTVTHAVTV